MENENVTNIESLKTIDIAGELITGSVGVFKTYKARKEVAEYLVRDMAYKGYYRERINKKKRITGSVLEGFKMSDEMPQVGALSIGPALSTMFMELDKIEDNDKLYDSLVQSAIEPKDGADTKKGGSVELSVLDAIKASILQLLAGCYVEDDDSTIVFEASPFYNESEVASSDIDSVKWPESKEKFLIKGKDRAFEERIRSVKGYLDTASWVFLVTQLAREFLDRLINLQTDQTTRPALLTYETEWAEGYTTSTVKDKLNELYMASLRFACRCIVYEKDKDGTAYAGWMFTKSSVDHPCYTPDLYMSYAASTIYLGLYKEYAILIENSGKEHIEKKYVLNELRLLENFMAVAKDCCYEYGDITRQCGLTNENYFSCFKHETRDIKKLQRYVDALWAVTESRINTTNDPTKLFNKEIENDAEKRNIKDVYQEVKEFLEYLYDCSMDPKTKKVISHIEFLFVAINGDKPLTRGMEGDPVGGVYKDTPVYTILKEAATASARYFWEGSGDHSFKKNMALGPCYPDGVSAKEDSYTRSGHSNVLFNNLFAIGLIVNSAYDIEVLKKSLDDYNDMFQSFQIAVQDTQRRYNVMARNNTVYKVNSYILEFSEEADEVSAKIASRLRRVNITGCYLLPILFKTNGIIQNYLIEYPHNEMAKSLMTIIGNRKKKDAQTGYWVWDKDGYNAISNYYYVDALFTFYRYHEEYELPYTIRAEGLFELEKKFKDQIKQLMDENEIVLQKKIKDIEQEIEKEKEELQAQLDRFIGWRRAISEFIVSGLAEQLNKSFIVSPACWEASETDNGDSPKQCFTNAIKDGAKQPELTALLSWFSKMQLTTMLYGDWNFDGCETSDPTAFRKLIDKISGDSALKEMKNVVKKFKSMQSTVNELKKSENPEQNN